MQLSSKQIDLLKVQYLSCALQASKNDDNISLDTYCTISDIHPKARTIIDKLIQEFIELIDPNDLNLYLQDHNIEQLGCDLFLGFRNISDKKLTHRLTNLTNVIGEVILFEQHMYSEETKLYPIRINILRDRKIN